MFYEVKFKELLNDAYADLREFALKALNVDADEKMEDIDWVRKDMISIVGYASKKPALKWLFIGV